MKINWSVRIKNKTFWLAFIPAVLIFIQAVANVFGLVIDVGEIGNRLLAVVESAFLVLAIIGVINDPTTSGVSDSEQALTYSEPKAK